MMQLAIAAQVIGSIFPLNLLIIILHTTTRDIGGYTDPHCCQDLLVGGSSSLSPATCGVSHIHAQHSIS